LPVDDPGMDWSSGYEPPAALNALSLASLERRVQRERETTGYEPIREAQAPRRSSKRLSWGLV